MLDIHVEREMGQMDLRLRKVIERCCLGCGVGVMISIMIARWSEMVRSVCESCSMWIPMKQTRSRMCPWLWVGKCTCWDRLKQLSISRKSVVALQSGESM